MKTLLLLVGVIAVLAGILFMGQGSGNFPYPASSFMINATRWIYYGAGIAAVGLILIILSQR
jgi:hypothetical protein